MQAKAERQQIINPDWDFSKMGIGGLDTQFNAIFRLIHFKMIRYLINYFPDEHSRPECFPLRSWSSWAVST